MIYDARLFELNIQKKKFRGERPSPFIVLAAALYGNPLFLAVIGLFEFLTMVLLILPIPVYKDLVRLFVTYLPGHPAFFGNYLRSIYFKGKFGRMGKNVIIEQGVLISHPSRVFIDEMTLIDKNAIIDVPEARIGKRCHVCPQVMLIGAEAVEVGDYVAISHGAVIVTSSESPRQGARLSSTMVPLEQRNVLAQKVVIKKDGFVGAGAIVMPGVVIEEGSVVGAGVTQFKSTASWTIEYGLIPADRKIKTREKVNRGEL